MQKSMGRWGVLGILGKFLFLLHMCVTNTLAMGQPPQATKIYESSAQPFPPTLDGFNVIGHMAGGSGGVTILQDSRGQKFTLKCAKQTTQLKEEIMADSLYRAMGVPVPEFAVYNKVPSGINACQGQPIVRVSRFIESNPNATDEMKTTAMAKRFVADAFMSNWDIVIGGFKNVVMDNNGYLWRIDNGGSLRYRALGEAKKGAPEWDPEKVNDLDTMRDPQKSRDGAFVYGNLTPEEMRVQAQQIISRAPQILRTLESVSRAIDIENPDELRAMLSARLHDLANRFGLPIQPGRSAQITPSTYLARSHEKPTPQSAAGILIYALDPQSGLPLILLGKRIRHNWWGNLGGKSDVDPSQGPIDRTLMQTAIRETREESQDTFLFSDFELEQSPSHDLINSDGSLFRMYITPSHNFSPRDVPLNGLHLLEYTEFRWVPLKAIMLALSPNSPRIQEERQETVQVGDIILHAPLYRMLMEPAVQAQLQQILQNPRGKLRPLRTKTGYTGQERVTWDPVDMSRSLEKVPLGFNAAGQMVGHRALRDTPGSVETVPLSPENEEQQMAQTIARKSQLAGELRWDKPQLKKYVPPENEIVSTLEGIHISNESAPESAENKRPTKRQRTDQNPAPLNIEPTTSLSSPFPYTASDAFLQVMMGGDYNRYKDNPTELINLFFDKPYTRFNEEARESFKNPHFRKELVSALEEERKHPGWYVFYHGTDPKVAFMSDILSTYRARFQGTHAKSDPKFRFLDQPFIDLKNADEVMESFNGQAGSGTNPLNKRNINTIGIYVNVGLFGSDNSPGSSSILFFSKNKSLKPPNEMGLFNAVRKEIGFDKTWEDFQPLFDEYQRNSHRLYQIFIHPDYVDENGWFPHSGLNINGKKADKLTQAISLFRSNPLVNNEIIQNNVHAFLFLKPDVFDNPDMVQIRVYNNRPENPQKERAFWKKLDAMVTEDVTNWILKKEKMSEGTIGTKEPPLESLAKQAYQGEASTPYELKDPNQKKMGELLRLLWDGNIGGVQSFIRSNPTYPINTPLKHIDYYHPENSFEMPPLFFVLIKGNANKEKLVELLIAGGADVSAVHDGGKNILDLAIMDGMKDLFVFLVTQPAPSSCWNVENGIGFSHSEIYCCR